jgi:hypothetical protein
MQTGEQNITMIRGLFFLALVVGALCCLGYGAQQYREAGRWQHLAKFWEKEHDKALDNNGLLVDQMMEARDEAQRLKMDLARATAPVIKMVAPVEPAPTAPVTPVARTRSHYPTVDPSVSRFYPGVKSAADRAVDALESIETQMLLNPRR